MQMLRGIQGNKHDDHKWYQLLNEMCTIFFGVVVSAANKGLFYWEYQGHYVYIALDTDDIILVVSYVSVFKRIPTTFDQYFS